MEQAQLIEQITRIAVEKVIEALEQMKEQEEEKRQQEYKRQQDRRLWNTKLLLKHYPELKEYVQKVDKQAKTVIPQIQVDISQNIIDLITFGDDMVKSIKEISRRTIAMVQHLDIALDTLEYMYKQEKNEKYFNILKKRYMQGMDIIDIAELYRMNERSVYKVLNSVIDRLSVLLFGVYGLRVEGEGH